MHEVLTSILKKENGEKATVSPTIKPDELRAYFAEVLPNFDRDRVYPSDIKKILSWYNILLSNGITDFTPKEEAEKTEEAPAEEAKPEESEK